MRKLGVKVNAAMSTPHGIPNTIFLYTGVDAKPIQMSFDDQSTENIPLCVDLDGTFIRTDMLHETLIKCIKKNPLNVINIVFWMLRGRSYLKFKAAEIGFDDAKNLPYQTEVVQFVQGEWHKKRPIYLVTAAAARIAQAVTKERPFFTEAISSSETVNLKSHEKAAALSNRFGEKGFDYIGNSIDDIAVFKKARAGYFVTDSSSLAKVFEKKYKTQAILVKKGSVAKSFLRSIRIHQWAKNMLIFVPLILAHAYGRIDFWIDGLIAFICFGLCASGVYLLNDLLDVDADRKHHTKKNRPIAAGWMSVGQALLVAVLFWILAFAGATLFLPLSFVGVLAVYYIYTCLYSFWLKQELVLDTVSLALLYTVRIVAGHAATGVPLSNWLLAFSLFLFLSLAFLKRTSELFNMRSKNIHAALGRAYTADDFLVVQNLGVSSGFISVLVFVLYLDSGAAKNLYSQASLLTLIIPVFLYWIGRAWVLATRGQINEDPIIWSLKDKVSRVVVVLILVIFFMAQLNRG